MRQHSFQHTHQKIKLLFIAIVAMILTLSVLALNSSTNAAPDALTNPSLEQVTGSTPTCFTRSGWGNNSVSWSLTTAARTGSVAQSITVTQYVSGDRKLMVSENGTCAPAVTPGMKYKIGAWYKSTSTKNALTVFRHTATGWVYWMDLKQLPAATAWTEATATTPEVPAGTDQISFGISLAGNGTLVTDDYVFAHDMPAPPPPPPADGELMPNPGLESGGATPDGWERSGWGDAVVTSAVTSDAHGGTRAYEITLAGRTQGDYKLLTLESNSPAVEPGAKYDISAWYKSTAASNSLTLFKHTAAGWSYWTELASLSPAAGWTQITAETPVIPSDVNAIKWGVSIASDGTLKTDDYSLKKQGSTLPPPPESSTGKWSVLDYQMPIRAIHSTLLKNGKVLLIAGSGNDVDQFKAGTFKASIWDPVAGTFSTLSVPKDMFCAGHVTLPDGRVLIQGGTKSYPTAAGKVDYGGLRDSWIFNPDNNTFTPTNLANEGHWYPTLTELGNGDIWMAGGLKEDTAGAVNTEYFSYASGQWLPTNQIPQTWMFWGLYPHMFLMQDGRLFYSGGHVFGNGLPGTGASIYDYPTATITPVSGLRMKDMRDQSASVLLPPAQDQRVMITGGGNIDTGNPAISLTDLIDLKQATPTYQPGPDMPGMGKMYVNATTLPDRTVLTTNGAQLDRNASSQVLTAAIYLPLTNTWQTVPADPIGRNYHSSALLLPDGRVAVLGSNPSDNTFELRISIYQPSYLFRGARPTVSASPAQVTYGQKFNFTAAAQNGKTIKWAQLMRPMSVTHQMDSNMRLVDLPMTISGTTVSATVTSNRNILPPGPYLLTVTDSDNVPSMATWVMVR